MGEWISVPRVAVRWNQRAVVPEPSLADRLAEIVVAGRLVMTSETTLEVLPLKEPLPP